MTRDAFIGATLATALAVGTATLATPVSAQMGVMGPGYGPGMMYDDARLHARLRLWTDGAGLVWASTQPEPLGR